MERRVFLARLLALPALAPIIALARPSPPVKPLFDPALADRAELAQEFAKAYDQNYELYSGREYPRLKFAQGDGSMVSPFMYARVNARMDKAARDLDLELWKNS